MNIIRRLFGKKSASEPPTAEEDIQESPILAEEDEPETFTIPGVGAEIPLDSSPPTAAISPGEYGVTRQLPDIETVVTGQNQHIIFGHSTDVGMVRTNNQDAVLTFFASQSNANGIPDFGFFVVADGMGGHHDGEKASAIATQVLAEQITRHIYLPMLVPDTGNGSSSPPISEVLINSVKASNDLVVKLVPDGGTTITAVTIVGDIAHFVHVGDSRAYLLTNEHGLEQITRDHSLVQRLIELDQLTPDEAAQHPQKNVLYRAIGQSDHLEVDTITRRLPANSYLLLCSDGLWNTVPEEIITEIVLNSPAPQEACDRLVAAANEHGGTDNISAIVLQVPG